MKSILTNASPKECELVASGKQTILVRKTRPKIETSFNGYLYATKPKRWLSCDGHIRTSDECLWLVDGEVKMCDGLEFWANGYNDYQRINGKVIGEFVCDRIYTIKHGCGGFTIDNDIALTNRTARESCLQFADLQAYLGKNDGYAWHISDLKIYDKPKELGEFFVKGDCENFDFCYRCKYYYRRDAFSEAAGIESGCTLYDDLKSLTRPPQSWCYVETEE